MQKVLEIVATSFNGVATGHNISIHTQILNFNNSAEFELFKSKLITHEYTGKVTIERRIY